MNCKPRGFKHFMTKKRHPYKYLRALWWKFWMNFSIKILDQFDWHLKMLGYTKRQRKVVWRQYHEEPALRAEILNKMTQKY